MSFNVWFVTEETHGTGETELWQGDEVQILWNTDVVRRRGHFSTIASFSVRQHLCSTISPLLQTIGKTTTNMDIIPVRDQRFPREEMNFYLEFKMKLFFFTFLIKLLLFWTRLKAGPINWLELVSLETKGGAWTCSTSPSNRGNSSSLLCTWSYGTVRNMQGCWSGNKSHSTH